MDQTSKQKTLNKEKEKLDHKKRKLVINDLMMKLSDNSPELYYMPTVEVAQHIWDYISSEANPLPNDHRELIGHLSVRDIQILLGHHSDTKDHLL